MKKTRHIDVSISYLLSLDDKTMGDIFTDEPATELQHLQTGKEVRELMEEKLAAGERLIGSSACVGFNPVTGCPGHEN